jgi:hypothetical protein
VELSVRPIDPGSAAAPVTAMLNIIVLSNQHKFQLNDFLSGNLPPREEVAVAQTLTNLS